MAESNSDRTLMGLLASDLDEAEQTPDAAGPAGRLPNVDARTGMLLRAMYGPHVEPTAAQRAAAARTAGGGALPDTRRHGCRSRRGNGGPRSAAQHSSFRGAPLRRNDGSCECRLGRDARPDRGGSPG